MMDGRIIQPGDPGWMPPPSFPNRDLLRRWERERRWTPMRIYKLPVRDLLGREMWRIEEEFYTPIPLPGLYAAVVFNNAATAAQGTTSPTSNSFSTTAGGSNLCGFAPVAYDANSGMSISGIAYAAAALTPCGTASHDTTTQDYSEIWYRINPATGANTLAVTVSGTIDDIYRGWATYTGVDQTTPVRSGTYFNFTGSLTTDGSGNYTKVVTSQTDDMTLTCVNGGGNNNITSNKTRRGSSAAGNRSFAHDDAAGAATVTHTWSGGGAGVHCTMCGFSIAAVSAGGASVVPVLMSQYRRRVH